MTFEFIGRLGSDAQYSTTGNVTLSVNVGQDLEAGVLLVAFLDVSAGDSPGTPSVAGQPFNTGSFVTLGHVSSGNFYVGSIYYLKLGADIASTDDVTSLVTRSGSEVDAGMIVLAFRGVDSAIGDYAGQAPTTVSGGASYSPETRIYNETRTPAGVLVPASTQVVGPAAAMTQAHELYVAVIPFFTVNPFSRYFDTTTFTPAGSWSLEQLALHDFGTPRHGFIAAWEHLETPDPSNPEIVDLSRNGAATDGLVYGMAWNSWSASSINASGGLSVAHNFLRSRFRAYQDAGVVGVERYDDAFPPVVAATVTVESSGGQGTPDIDWRRDGVGELIYAKSNTVYERQSRDQGRSWAVADTVATGYQDACEAVYEGRGLKVVGLYDEAAQKWYVSVGRENGGTWGDWSTPTQIAASAKAGASMKVLTSGVAEFDYTTTGNVRTTLRCRAFSNLSNGTWA